MKFYKLFTLIFCIISFSSMESAQTPKPKASPTVPVDVNEEIVKISTTLIQVDVTVTGKNGNVITDLKPEDFEIYENGKKQHITNFSFVSNDASQIAISKGDNESKLKSSTLSSELTLKQTNRTIALVIDDISLSFDNVYYVKRALRKFVEEQMQPNDLVAIIRTGGGSGFLQQFTFDKRQLLAAVETVRWNPAGQGKISSFEPLEAEAASTADPNNSAQIQTEKELQAGGAGFKQMSENFRKGVYSTGTLGTLNSIISGMRELPGRKSVMLLSEGFKISERGHFGKEKDNIIFPILQKIIDAANRASVVIYTIDIRGVQTLELNAADNTTGRSVRQLLGEGIRRAEEVFDTQDGLIYLADQTGGIPIKNSNNFNNGLQKMLDDQGGYYLIGYQPDSEIFDSKLHRFNKLTVKVIRKNTNVRYRSGFFGNADEKSPRETKPATAAEQIVKAVTSPFSSGNIDLRLNNIFGYDKKLGSYIQSLVYINPQDLKFSDEPNREKKTVFDVLAVSFGEKGVLIDQISKTYTLTVNDEDYQKIIQSGFVYNFTFPLKMPGAYQMRVAIRDSTTGKIGSANEFLDVPDLKKGQLTISGMILENLTLQQWQNFSKNNQIPIKTNPLIDTSLRRFKRGTILRYGFEIYNAKSGQNRKPDLTVQRKLFHDGKLVFTGESFPVEFSEQTDVQKINSMDSINLKTEMPIGDYFLQIIVTDKLAKDNNKTAVQSLQFELID